MKVHRLARVPPCGYGRHGKRRTLCGRDLLPRHLTTHLADVTCGGCLIANDSSRTTKQRRIAMACSVCGDCDEDCPACLGGGRVA